MELIDYKVSVRPINAGMLELINLGIPPKERTFNDTIVELEFDQELIIAQGTEIELTIGDKPTVYKINDIYKDEEGIYYLYTRMFNRSGIYLLPTLGYSREEIGHPSKGSRLENVYTGSEYKDYDFPTLHLMYRFTATESFKKFEYEVSKLKLCFDKYEPDPYHVVYVFGVPEAHHEDIKRFHEGKYTKLTDTLKKKIEKFHGLTKNHRVTQIINGDVELRQSLSDMLACDIEYITELDSIPLVDLETLRVQRYARDKRVKL